MNMFTENYFLFIRGYHIPARSSDEGSLSDTDYKVSYISLLKNMQHRNCLHIERDPLLKQQEQFPYGRLENGGM